VILTLDGPTGTNVAETSGPLKASVHQLSSNLGREISSTVGGDRKAAFQFRRVLMLVRCFNAVLLHDSFPAPDYKD